MDPILLVHRDQVVFRGPPEWPNDRECDGRVARVR